MKHYIQGVLLGAGLALAIAASAVTTGGFPSFLRVQSLGANVIAPAAGIVNAATDVQVAGVSLCQSGGTHCPTAAPVDIACTTTCSVTGIVVGQSAIIDLTSVSITSNATLAVNALNFSNMPTGSYEIRMVVPITAATGGQAVGWTSCASIGAYGTGVIIASNATTGWGTSNCNTVSGSQNNTTAGGAFVFNGVYNNAVSNASTTFAWSQATSNASPSIFCSPDCTAVLTRIH
jgi:hypothetical protein